MKDSNWSHLIPALIVLLIVLAITRCRLTITKAELNEVRARLEALENPSVRSTGDHSVPYYPENPSNLKSQ